MPNELKPCPFCGEPAESDMQRGFVDYKFKHWNATAIYCTKCEADMTLCHDDFPEHTSGQLLEILTEKWNTRDAKLVSVDDPLLAYAKRIIQGRNCVCYVVKGSTCDRCKWLAAFDELRNKNENQDKK